MSRQPVDLYANSGSIAINEVDAALMRRRQNLLGPFYRLLYDEPFHPVRAEGVWLFDANGDRYLDAYNNVPCVGHCHPKVLAAMTKQAAILNTHTRYLDETILNYADALRKTLPKEIDRLTLICTGSEANDLALRIANFRVDGKAGVVVTEQAYHGGTVAVAEITPSLGVGVGEHVRTVAAPDAYRRGNKGLGEVFAADVAAAFADLEACGYKPGAFVFDSIFASDGVLPDPAGFLQAACNVSTDAGALVVADEVQAGFARTGDAFWGFERHGIVPDIVTMGKPMGNGHPIAGLAARSEVLDAFADRTCHFNTFGGNPVSCAAGLAVLEAINDEDLLQNSHDVGAYLRQGLQDLATTHPVIGDVRGAGLFVGCELVSDRESKDYGTDEARRLVNELRQRRVLVAPSGIGGNVLKIRPPLPFGREHADLFIETMDIALRHLKSQGA